jgi:hypothetical protein
LFAQRHARRSDQRSCCQVHRPLRSLSQRHAPHRA